MQNDCNNQKLELMKRQFLCSYPVKEICWKNFSDLNTTIQEQIINNTVRLESVLKYPIDITYQKTFLKSLLQYLEKQNSVITDSLYEEYGRLVALPNNNINFKHYLIEGINKNIVLKEDIRLISEGTTGLRTWQAALALSEWILANRDVFTSKKILELGSGIGLTGLTLLNCKPKAVYLSDCHLSVLSTLCDNIQLNLSTQPKNIKNGLFLLEEYVNCDVKVIDLPWEDVCLKICKKLGQIDVIVAADVVYDCSIFQCLISAVNSLFDYCGVKTFYLSCTERNTDTLNSFLNLLNKNYIISNIEVPQQQNFIWNNNTSIKIFKITRLQTVLCTSAGLVGQRQFVNNRRSMND